MLKLTVDTIFGVNVGFEYIPKETMEAFDDPTDWAIMIDLLIFRLVISKISEEE